MPENPLEVDFFGSPTGGPKGTRYERVPLFGGYGAAQAAPSFDLLDEVIVDGSRASRVPAGSLSAANQTIEGLSVLGRTLLQGANLLGLLLQPMNSGRPGQGELEPWMLPRTFAPDEPEVLPEAPVLPADPVTEPEPGSPEDPYELPEIIVVPPPQPYTPPAFDPFDPFTPHTPRYDEGERFDIAPGLPNALPRYPGEFGDPFSDPFSEPRPAAPGSPVPDRSPANPRAPAFPGPTAEPDGAPDLDPFAPGLPRAAPQPAPRPDPSQRPDLSPELAPFPDPFAMPSPSPNPQTQPLGDPLWFNTGDDRLTFGDPIGIPQPGKDLDPLPDPQPNPEEDPCNCDKKKKKKKKSQPRDVCYRGTYRQLKKGIIYNKLEEIPCDSKAGSPKKSARTARRKKPKSITDLAKEIFNLGV